MIEHGLFSLVALVLLFGLFRLIEPGTIGTTLILIRQIEGRGARQKLVQMTIFAPARAPFIGALGVAAALAGTAILGFQRASWGALGALHPGGW